MRKTTQHLDDEHMLMYEWSGAGAGTICDIPAQSKRTHPWHAANSVLALMSSLLILGGCNTQSPAEQTSEQAVDKMKAGPLYEQATSRPAPAESPEAAGYAMGEVPAEQPAR
jgi:hypothetical protein